MADGACCACILSRPPRQVRPASPDRGARISSLKLLAARAPLRAVIQNPRDLIKCKGFLRRL
eukprot:6207559-Pleurochrysis_carterae.AAC.2